MSENERKSGRDDSLDPVVTSVIASRLEGIGRKMGTTIERSARSPLLVEGRDFSVGIYDANGVLIHQTEYIPILGYATAPGVQQVIDAFEGDINEGDVMLHNDVFTGGNQPSDWKVLKPVFVEDELVAWTVINAHQADVGGSVPGSYNPDATEIWQEALRIPPVKLYDGGERRDDVWELIFGNVRLDVVSDDVRAMIGGCTVGERNLHELLERYDVETFHRHKSELLDSTEKMVREGIQEIPDGTYESEVPVVDDGFDHEREMTIAVTIEVAGETMSFDFAGTTDQTPGYVNAPRAVTMSSVMITIFMILEEHIPHNDGILRCVDIDIPSGSMLNPDFPAASAFGNHLSDQICTVIMDALADAVPKRVTAGWNPLLCGLVSGIDPRIDEPYVDLILNGTKGGSGGTYNADGYDHIGLIASGGAIAAQDPEMFEIQDPHFLHHYEFEQDSAGAGRWRGGLGVRTEFEFLADGVEASIFGDGDSTETAAPGLFDGLRGSPNALELEYPDGDTYEPELKELVGGIPKGTTWKQVAGGGGGYGNPLERPVETVAEDVRNGLISPEAAKSEYGVVVTKDGTVNTDQTEQLRRELAPTDLEVVDADS
ncbi:hydantoinase B/oxoprolinase family protein [Natrarchaeobius chitinivorans]|uniref:Hydantoinase B/oxoprolinase family protein n=1 Tax=Natrarchaeobius chitinivorans TaxID=1679083 RepID=A0A3N6LR49_NATCH|nr:hydantoinase B/oxoprolinase family protein [Natrarchaeobius chitinivorans]RQG90827.1 hydantoinase B/oxoprolinase family protein [Natrarchaeobius chitinivorans]